MDIVHNQLKELDVEIIENEPMRKHTSFKIGGNARLFVTVTTIAQLQQVIHICKQNNCPVLVLGNGSNLLVSDGGINGVVLTMDGVFKDITLLDEQTVYCGAAVTLSKLCAFALEHSLSGLEFAWGIPGTAGGAAFMNAGAYGGEMRDVLLSCHHVCPGGTVGTIAKDDLQLSYRHSVYKENNCIITGLTVKLTPKPKAGIKEKMDDFMRCRKEKQPLEYPSAGSVFKRPQGNYAGTLIEQCGLKGKAIGGAQVSEKHAGFIINTGNATCKDVCDLIQYVQATVKEQTGYYLEREIILLEG